MRIPDHVVDEVARRVDIVELVGGYLTLTRKGARYFGLCPFHQERTASFSVDPEQGLYYCFGCHRGGGVFRFLMEIDGLSFVESVRTLAERVGVQIPESHAEQTGPPRKTLIELYTRVAATFVHFLSALPEGRAAGEVLKARAISETTIRDFGIGFSNPDPFWLHRFLRTKGYSADFLRNSGLFTRANTERALFAGRLMFPIRARGGEVVAFGGRIVDGDGPKYINSPETAIFRKREGLYGVDRALPAIREQRRAVLCEGYVDVLALHQAGVTGAVAPLGTAFTTEQGRFLARYIDSVSLLFDSDEAGVRATQRAAEILEKQGIIVSVCPLESGTDPAALLQTGGSRALVKAVSSPLTIVEFLVRQGLLRHPVNTAEGKEAILREVLPYVSAMGSAVRREESLDRVADLIGADRSAVRSDFGVFGRGERLHPHTKGDSGRLERSEAQPPGERQLSHDLFLMLATVRNRDMYPYVRRFVQPEDLDDAAAREVYLALEESFRRDEQAVEMLVARIAQPAVATLVRERIASSEFEQNEEQTIRDAVLAIRKRSLVRRRDAVERELRRSAASGTRGSEGELGLLAEKMHLDRELQKLKGESG